MKQQSSFKKFIATVLGALAFVVGGFLIATLIRSFF